MTEQWLSIVEYARTYKVSDMTVRRRIKTGKLHAVMQEGKYFIPVEGPVTVATGPGGGTQRPAGAPHYDQRAAASQLQPTPAAQPKRIPGEITVIKGHPAAHKTFQQQLTHHSEPPRHASQAPEPSPVHHDFRDSLGSRDSRDSHDTDLGRDAAIPPSLRRPLGALDTSLVDTRALLAFCDASLRKINDGERRTIERFKSKLETLEATLAGKDLEIKMLRQQVEDLQLLCKILEKKKQA